MQKIRKIFFLIIIILITLFLYQKIDFTQLASSSTVEYYVQDYGNIEVYFCPQENCEEKLVNTLNSAQESINCAFFELRLDSVKDKLLKKEKKQEISVKVITDNLNLEDFNHSFVRYDQWGLMHHKFCIIDGIKILTGSMNPTNNGAHKNNNNLLIINSKILAKNYQDEFEEMWNGTYKKGKKVRNPKIKLNEIVIENHFCPEDNCLERIKDKLKNAKNEIYFMTFSFTHPSIANILLLKNLDEVMVKGVMEARQVTKHSQFKRLNDSGIKVVKDKNKANMHHKVFIIDNETVITGSMNPSQGGNKVNDENVLIINDKDIAKLFLEEFERVYE